MLLLSQLTFQKFMNKEIPIDAVTSFYDETLAKRLADFMHNNERGAKAVEFACRQVYEEGCMNIADLGCGVGWSSVELIRAVPTAKVTAFDLSPQSIDAASKLFHNRQGLEFLCADLTAPQWSQTYAGCFDAIVLLDVYEHIPAQSRTDFHNALGGILASEGIIVITCPTTAHQRWLRKENPEGLQPIDEDVDVAVLHQLAQQVGGELECFCPVSIWHHHDYFHALIKRGGKFRPKSVAYRHHEMPIRDREKIVRSAGYRQIPAVTLAGRIAQKLSS